MVAVSLLHDFLQRWQFGDATGSPQHPSPSALPAAREGALGNRKYMFLGGAVTNFAEGYELRNLGCCTAICVQVLCGVRLQGMPVASMMSTGTPVHAQGIIES